MKPQNIITPLTITPPILHNINVQAMKACEVGVKQAHSA
jgi:hypothetical protein